MDRDPGWREEGYEHPSSRVNTGLPGERRSITAAQVRSTWSSTVRSDRTLASSWRGVAESDLARRWPGRPPAAPSTDSSGTSPGRRGQPGGQPSAPVGPRRANCPGVGVLADAGEAHERGAEPGSSASRASDRPSASTSTAASPSPTTATAVRSVSSTSTRAVEAPVERGPRRPTAARPTPLPRRREVEVRSAGRPGRCRRARRRASARCARCRSTCTSSTSSSGERRATANPAATSEHQPDVDEALEAAAAHAPLHLDAPGADPGVDGAAWRARACVDVGHRQPSTSGRGSGSKPTRRVSGCSWTPAWSRTERLHARRISARTSSARPPSSAWMKLACLVDTAAVPRRRPLPPAASISRPGRVALGVREHRAGVGAARLVGPPPGHDLGQLAVPAVDVAGGQGEPRRHHEVVRRDRRTCGSRGRARQQAPNHPPRCAGRRRGPCEHRGHVGAVAAGVHPHRPADGSRDADRPLEAGQAGGDGAPGHDRQGGRRARLDLRRRRPPPPRRRLRARPPARGSRRRRRAGCSPCRRRGRRCRSRPRPPSTAREVVLVARRGRRRAARPPTRYVVRRARAARRARPDRPSRSGRRVDARAGSLIGSGPRGAGARGRGRW